MQMCMQMQLKLESRLMTARRHFMNVSTRLALAVALAGSPGLALAQKPPVTLLNVSYDPAITFVQRNVGDVLLAWENEAFLALKEFGAEKFEVVVPSISILAEPTVTAVDKNIDKKGTRAVATAYLEYLYSDEGQDIAGRNYYRPTGEKAKAKYASQFPQLTLFTIDQGFGGWTKADKDHFADGASFDQIYTQK